MRIPLIRRPGLFIGGGGEVLRPPAVGGVAQDKAAAELHEEITSKGTTEGVETYNMPTIEEEVIRGDIQ